MSTASIIAKVARDAHMCELECCYPGCGLGIHKGYSTPTHLAALERPGPSAVHRTPYAPVQSALVI